MVTVGLTLDERLGATVLIRVFDEFPVSRSQCESMVSGDDHERIVRKLLAFPDVRTVLMSYGGKIECCEIEINSKNSAGDYVSIIRAHPRASIALALTAISASYRCHFPTKPVPEWAWQPGDEIPVR